MFFLTHLSFILQITDEIRKRISFNRNDTTEIFESSKIVFSLSDKRLDIENILNTGEVPILFPIGKKASCYEWKDNTLVFNQDLLKQHSTFFPDIRNTLLKNALVTETSI